jgi:UDP-3-O-[3-hydroxymyristoyl] glucosamine N-acyltransferase
MVSGQNIPGGQDYGGVPAKPVREWLREVHALRGLANRKGPGAKEPRRRKQDDNGR